VSFAVVGNEDDTLYREFIKRAFVHSNTGTASLIDYNTVTAAVFLAKTAAAQARKKDQTCYGSSAPGIVARWEITCHTCSHCILNYTRKAVEQYN
jgi:hypothetical protein